MHQSCIRGPRIAWGFVAGLPNSIKGVKNNGESGVGDVSDSFAQLNQSTGSLLQVLTGSFWKTPISCSLWDWLSLRTGSTGLTGSSRWLKRLIWPAEKDVQRSRLALHNSVTSTLWRSSTCRNTVSAIPACRCQQGLWDSSQETRACRALLLIHISADEGVRGWYWCCWVVSFGHLATDWKSITTPAPCFVADDNLIGSPMQAPGIWVSLDTVETSCYP